MADLITEAEALDLGVAVEALSGVSSSQRAAAISAVSSFVLSRLAKRYKLPLVSWSDDVKRATAHIWAWDVLCLRGFNPENAHDLAIKIRADQAKAWFREVVAGDAEPEAIVDASTGVDERGPLVESDDPVGWDYPRDDSDVSAETGL